MLLMKDSNKENAEKMLNLLKDLLGKIGQREEDLPVIRTGRKHSEKKEELKKITTLTVALGTVYRSDIIMRDISKEHKERKCLENIYTGKLNKER